MNSSKRFAVIASTGASVLRAVYANTERSEFSIDLIVVDRDCGAKDFAVASGIELAEVHPDKRSISDAIFILLQQKKIDYVYLFFTKMLRGAIIDGYSGRMVNFHPSLLPACPGLHGFEDTLRSGSMLAGSTAHFVDAGTDTGRIIFQAFAPVHSVPQSRLRHVIFAQQCATLHAVHKKIRSDVELTNFDSYGSDLAQGFLPNVDADSIDLYKSILNQV